MMVSHFPWILSRLLPQHVKQVRYGLVVRISGSHPGGPGSIPGGRNQYFLSCLIDLFHLNYCKKTGNNLIHLINFKIRRTSLMCEFVLGLAIVSIMRMQPLSKKVPST